MAQSSGRMYIITFKNGQDLVLIHCVLLQRWRGAPRGLEPTAAHRSLLDKIYLQLLLLHCHAVIIRQISPSIHLSVWADHLHFHTFRFSSNHCHSYSISFTLVHLCSSSLLKLQAS